jgi:hypothetical protein
VSAFLLAARLGLLILSGLLHLVVRDYEPNQL